MLEVKETYLIFAEGKIFGTLLSKNGSMGSIPGLAVTRVPFLTREQPSIKTILLLKRQILTEEVGGSCMCPPTWSPSVLGRELHI